mmetsp:Transcript_12959/g.23832  ORF Transcript_12959/g.23832 Transcript_12959/m.23832 type:complete len:97 (-) Transcript_12959:436-726(-)
MPPTIMARQIIRYRIRLVSPLLSAIIHDQQLSRQTPPAAAARAMAMTIANSHSLVPMQRQKNSNPSSSSIPNFHPPPSTQSSSLSSSIHQGFWLLH